MIGFLLKMISAKTLFAIVLTVAFGLVAKADDASFFRKVNASDYKVGTALFANGNGFEIGATAPDVEHKGTVTAIDKSGFTMKYVQTGKVAKLTRAQFNNFLVRKVAEH